MGDEDVEARKREDGVLRGDSRLIPSTIAIVAAAVLVAAFFLPFASAVGDFRSSLENHPDEWYDESIGITASDAMDLSLFEYAKAYASLPGLGWDESWMVLAGVIATAGVFAVAALIFALLRKAVPTALFAFCAMAVSRIVVWDFGERGVVPTSSYDLGIASAVYLVAGIIAIAAAVWLFVVKSKAKRIARC